MKLNPLSLLLAFMFILGMSCKKDNTTPEVEVRVEKAPKIYEVLWTITYAYKNEDNSCRTWLLWDNFKTTVQIQNPSVELFNKYQLKETITNTELQKLKTLYHFVETKRP